jgi:hypothetical protein
VALKIRAISSHLFFSFFFLSLFADALGTIHATRKSSMSISRAQWFSIGTLLFSVPGCFATPPVRFAIGAGGALGSNLPKQDSREKPKEKTTTSALYPLRLSVSPFQFMPRQISRRIDVDAGYTWEWWSAKGDDGYKHGPGLRLTCYPKLFCKTSPKGEEECARVGLFSEGLLLFGDIGQGTEIGSGVNAGLTFDINYFLKGEFHHASAGGVGYGEWSLGLFAQAGVRRIHEQTYAILTAGVTIGYPAMIGAGWR